MDLANRIRSARKAKGMTQEELARRAGVGLNIVNRIERGVVTDPHYSTLSGLAAALNTSISRLVEEPDLAGKAEAPGTRPTQGGIGQDIEEVYAPPLPPKSRSAAELAPEIDFSRVDLVESRAAADVLVVSRRALIEALEHVRDGVWSVEDAERVLERKGFLWEGGKVTGEEFFEQMRKGVGKWSTS